jgi:hypothetical protein
LATDDDMWGTLMFTFFLSHALHHPQHQLQPARSAASPQPVRPGRCGTRTSAYHTSMRRQEKTSSPIARVPFSLLRTQLPTRQDFLATDRGVFDDAAYSALVQLPLAAQAMAMAYNIPTLNSTDPALVHTSRAQLLCGCCELVCHVSVRLLLAWCR